MSATVLHGDCRGVLAEQPADSFASVVTDPPYELGFMGKSWDKSGVAFDPATWAAVLRVLRPGGYMLAMGGTRTYHRLTCAVEDAGFEVRDCLMWMYGQGMPKGKGCLKPAWEPILLARKPGPRVLPLGIGECRVPTDAPRPVRERDAGRLKGNTFRGGEDGSLCGSKAVGDTLEGRWPANVLHDGSDEVLDAFAEFGSSGASQRKQNRRGAKSGRSMGYRGGKPAFEEGPVGYADTGTAARFFYTAKASKSERGEGNTHPTVKPLALMRWMVRLVTPEGGRVLDPFAGSGSTLVAALLEGRESVGVELDAEHCEIIKRRLAEHAGTGLFADV